MGAKKSGGLWNQMRLLYLGHYKENSGWSYAAMNAIEAINTTDIDIVCRDIKLTETAPKVPEHIMMLEKKSLKELDFCIQHLLPHHIVGTNKFKKNIAYFVAEAQSIRYHHWSNNLSLVDEIWVPNCTMRDNLINDGFKNKIKVIPHTFNIKRYVDNRHRINFHEQNHTFKFYVICDLDDRKNLESILRCFHSEFHVNEPVSLVLKVKKTGMNKSPDALRNEVNMFCNKVKQSMRIYPNLNNYHQEIIISEDFTDDQMDTLHLSCDCFVCPTHGEGWSIPSFDAMCFGKTPICSNEGGPKEFIDPNNKKTGYLINGQNSICNHRDPAFPDLFTGLDTWFAPNELEIKNAMRFYYENDHRSNNKDGLFNGKRFSYENVGIMIKEALYE